MKEPYKSKCIIRLKSGNYVRSPDKETESIHEAKVFRSPQAANHLIDSNIWRLGVKATSGRFNDAIILPVRLVQIGKPLKEGEDRKWYQE